MNFDELKDAWANEKSGDAGLPLKRVPSGATFSAVSEIRKNMRRELIAQIGGFVILIFVFVITPKSPLSLYIAAVAIFILIIQTVYYFSRFYLFYKAIGRRDLALRRSIYKIAYELELNIEIYKTFNFCAVPLIVLIIAGSGLDLRSTSLLLVFAMLAGAQIVVVLVLKLHLDTRYGRHLTELKKIMEDLEGEE
jgi:Flp pilus assembly protein TadB